MSQRWVQQLGGDKGRPMVFAAFRATCSEWKEATQRGSNSVMHPWWDREIPQPALAEETPHCTLGSRSRPTRNVECQSLLSCCFCAHRSLWAEGCCVGSRPRGFIPFPLIPVFPPPASPPLFPLCFILLLSLSFKTRVQRINIPWLVNGIPDPALGHYSPLSTLVGAPAGKQLPVGTVRAPKTFSSQSVRGE